MNKKQEKTEMINLGINSYRAFFAWWKEILSKYDDIDSRWATVDVAAAAFGAGRQFEKKQGVVETVTVSDVTGCTTSGDRVVKETISDTISDTISIACPSCGKTLKDDGTCVCGWFDEGCK